MSETKPETPRTQAIRDEFNTRPGFGLDDVIDAHNFAEKLELETQQLQQRVRKLEEANKVLSLRDGNWMDSHGACRVCDGEIPHGHRANCDVYKLESKVWELERTAANYKSDLRAADEYAGTLKNQHMERLLAKDARIRELEADLQETRKAYKTVKEWAHALEYRLGVILGECDQRADGAPDAGELDKFCNKMIRLSNEMTLSDIKKIYKAAERIKELEAEVERLKKEAQFEKDLPSNLLDVHAICEQRDRAVMENNTLRAELSELKRKNIAHVARVRILAKYTSRPITNRQLDEEIHNLNISEEESGIWKCHIEEHLVNLQSSHTTLRNAAEEITKALDEKGECITWSVEDLRKALTNLRNALKV